MSSSKAKKFGFLAAGIALFSLAAIEGCSSGDDTQAQPTAGSGPTAGSAGKTVEEAGAAGMTSGGGTGGTASGGAAGVTGTEAGAAGSAGAGEAGAAGAPATLTCEDGQAACFCGAPSTPAQFANGCVSGGCPSTFDNSKLTQIAKVGTL